MKEYVLYRIFYSNSLIAYVGQTTQNLKDRMYQHFFKDVDLDITCVKKIDYAICKTRADLNVYEMYYINKIHSFENRLGWSDDELSITLPELEFQEFDCSILEKYKKNDKIIVNRSTRLPKADFRFFE